MKRHGLMFLPHWHRTWNWLHTVTVIMQVTKKQGGVFMVVLCIFVKYLLHGEAKA